MVRGCVRCHTPGAARWLAFRPSSCLLLALFLITGFSAVGDFRQELANVFYFCFSPEVYCDPSARGCFRLGDFAGLDIAAQRHGSNTKPLSSLSGGESLHSDRP